MDDHPVSRVDTFRRLRGRAQESLPLNPNSSFSPASSMQSSPVPSHETLHLARLLPSQERSLAAIALHAFVLGAVPAMSLSLVGLLIYLQLPVWRAPFFLGVLAVFHFLEFYITARYNTAYANISAFLLSRNGAAYNVAHTAAMTECILVSLLFPGWQKHFAHPVLLALGLTFLIMGQGVRTTAMAQAGTNFNHTVQTRKAEGHALVTRGLYRWFRHPSYFGFFWWALGTQLMIGNVVCFVGYTVVLWQFFGRRIAEEEKLLVGFFGDEYLEYRSNTSVGIPFIP